MEKIMRWNGLGVLTAGLLITSFVLYPPSRVSSVRASSPVPSDLKKESQFRSEAAQYDRAMRAISEVGTMRLDTADDLKTASATLDRNRITVELLASKLVTSALSDSAFVAGVRKKMPDRAAAEAFSLELKADRKAILRVDGANALNSRLERALDADATTMRGAGQRLKEAADRIKKSQPQRSHHRNPNGLYVPAGLDVSPGAESPLSATLILPLLIIGAMATASVVVVITLGEILVISFFAAVTKPTAGTSECVEDLERRYKECVALANIFPPPFNITPLAACDAERLMRIAGCVLTGQS